MTTLPDYAFYNLKEIEELLEASRKNIRNRVCDDAVAILKYVNGKIATKAHKADTHLGVATYYIKLSSISLKEELGLTPSQIKEANKKLSALGYMTALTPKMIDGEWLHIWKVGPTMHLSMTQFAMTEATTPAELNKEFLRWVGTHWDLVLAEDTEEVILTEDNLTDLKEIWIADRTERQTTIDSQMEGLLDIMS